MNVDIIFELREWKRVHECVDQLNESGESQAFQHVLADLFKHPFNWRLRREAAQSVSMSSAPEDQVLLILLAVVDDPYTDFDLRIQAADALCCLINMRQKLDRCSEELNAAVNRRVRAARDEHHPVEFQRALERVIRHTEQHHVMSRSSSEVRPGLTMSHMRGGTAEAGMPIASP